jgi:hypothetical protein
MKKIIKVDSTSYTLSKLECLNPTLGYEYNPKEQRLVEIGFRTHNEYIIKPIDQRKILIKRVICKHDYPIIAILTAICLMLNAIELVGSINVNTIKAAITVWVIFFGMLWVMQRVALWSVSVVIKKLCT